MKRIVSILLLITLFAGCNDGDAFLQRALNLRDTLCKSDGFTFTANITADYGDSTATFSVECTADNNGNVTFTVINPEAIRGISGKLSSEGGMLTFDDTVLAFPLLAEGEVSPVSAPMLLVKTLLGGYISSCGSDNGMLRITMDDSYENDALRLEVWLNEQDLPTYTEIIWQGRRILSMSVDNFIIM